MKKTALYEKHVALSAKIVPFAGFEMPVSYTNISDEHEAVRNGVGIFDVSHMGEFIVRGKEALDFVQSISSNNAAKLEPGDAQYSCIPNDRGGIIDDMIVYRLFNDQCSEGEMAFMLVVNGSNIDKDWNWVEERSKAFDTRLINISDQTGLVAVQGPKAVDLLNKYCEEDLCEVAFYNFIKTTFAGCDNVVVSNTGYTGSGGMEIYANNHDIVKIWDLLMSENPEIKPCGLGARDTLRLEMGYCLYGNDINDETSPIEAGLSWIVKTKKGASFPSLETFQNQRAEGVSKKLMGFVLEGKRVPRKDYKLFDDEDNEIGFVTSGTMSPSLDQPIGMGYIKTDLAKEGLTIYVEFRNKRLPAVTKRPPFVLIEK